VFQRYRLAPPAAGEIYVNRGFVPQAQKLLSSRPRSVATGHTEISGLLRRAEARGAYSNANDIGKNVYYVRAPMELGVAEPVPPPPGPSPRYYYVDQIGPAPPGDLPYPMAARIDIPNRHLEYALTWYGLAVTLLVIVAVFARQRLQHSAPSP
jgi:surfeit locus 1 family protein